MIGLLMLIYSCCVPHASATVDLTLPEVQHLAQHLTRDECHRLVAALHFNSFKLGRYKTLEDAENALPEDVSCLKLLLEWNSDEGRGKTHEKISLRLRQIGRPDLASWLDSAVLNELQEEINKVAQELTTQEQNLPPIQVFENPDDFENKFIRNDEIWAFVPSVTVIAFIIIAIFTITYLVHQVVRRYRLSRWEKIDKDLKLNQDELEWKWRNNIDNLSSD